jgi:ABC-type dipeptide/oligopeptide/nickel transport system ATPase component
MSDTAGVMRKGALVEVGPAAEVLMNPRHEYTQSLLAAMPETPGMAPLPRLGAAPDAEARGGPAEASTKTSHFAPSPHEKRTLS